MYAAERLRRPLTLPAGYAGGRLACAAATLSLCLLAVGCATPVQVQRQATGDARAAYELRGRTLAELENEGRRLCPNGVDVQRAAETFEPGKPPRTGWISRWWDAAAQQVAPPAGQAQLAIVCRG